MYVVSELPTSCGLVLATSTAYAARLAAGGRVHCGRNAKADHTRCSHPLAAARRGGGARTGRGFGRGESRDQDADHHSFYLSQMRVRQQWLARRRRRPRSSGHEVDHERHRNASGQGVASSALCILAPLGRAAGQRVRQNAAQLRPVHSGHCNRPDGGRRQLVRPPS